VEKKARIFMVDDDTDLVMVVKSVLETDGYEFWSASSAREAIERVDEVQPDLIILDVMMEDVVAGFRVVNFLRNIQENPQSQKYLNVPILMLTSVQQKLKMKFAEDAGSKLLPIDSFLEKPVKPRVLLTRVAELLERRGGA
jgi:CheY-like chemotaxis protein